MVEGITNNKDKNHRHGDIAQNQLISLSVKYKITNKLYHFLIERISKSNFQGFN